MTVGNVRPTTKTRRRLRVSWVAGALVMWSRRRAAGLLLVWTVLLSTLNETLMIAGSRYHLPLVPAFSLLAAYGVVAVGATVKSRALLRRRPQSRAAV